MIMEELSMSWNDFIHPDMEAIERRDEFLNSNLCENIEFVDGEIHTDNALIVLEIKQNDI